MGFYLNHPVGSIWISMHTKAVKYDNVRYVYLVLSGNIISYSRL